MGYYTSMTTDWVYAKDVAEDKKQELREKFMKRLQDYIDVEWYVDGDDGCYVGSVKWYDHEMDMRELSKEFPEMTFTLDGQGEDSEDMWRAYFHNGQSFVGYAEITYPPNPFL